MIGRPRKSYKRPPRRAYMRAWMKRRREVDPAFREAQRLANWASRIKTLYRITPEEYQALLDGQGGACACGTRPTTRRRLAICPGPGGLRLRCNRCTHAGQSVSPGVTGIDQTQSEQNQRVTEIG